MLRKTTVNKIKNFRGEAKHTNHPILRVNFEGGWCFSIALGFDCCGFGSNVKLITTPKGKCNSLDCVTIETTDLQDILKFCDLVVSGIIDIHMLSGHVDVRTVKALIIPKNSD